MGKKTRRGFLGRTSIALILLLLIPIPFIPYDTELLICPLKKCLVKSTRLFSVDHRAVDIESDTGGPVYAVASGKVYLSGIDATTGNAKRIVLIHDDGYVSLYWHLSRISVNARDPVYKGQVIGYTGQTGWADWPHLHFGLIDPGGNYLNPLGFIDMEIQ